MRRKKQQPSLTMDRLLVLKQKNSTAVTLPSAGAIEVEIHSISASILPLVERNCQCMDIHARNVAARSTPAKGACVMTAGKR